MKVLTSILPDGVWVLPPEQVERLRELFPSVTFVDAPEASDRLRELPDSDVAFLSRLGPEEFAVARRLRWIQSPAAGVGGLLFPALRDSDVLLTNARGIHADPIAEHVLGVSIVLFRQIHRAIRRQVAHEWSKDDLQLGEYRTLRRQCMAIVGLGAIGTAIAVRAAAFGMRVIAVRRHAEAPRPDVVSSVYLPSELGVALSQADIVVLAAPLTAETRGLIGSGELRRMKPRSILINIARGKLVRENDLVEALREGWIGGAALDVFEHEPLDPASPLWDLPNVLVTPHTAGFRGDYWQAAVDLFALNLARRLAGQPLLNVVDKRAGY